MLLTRFPDLDAVVRGEGEYAMLELVQAVEQGRAPGVEGWGRIRGISLRGPDGAVVRTSEREPVPDLDALPNPARYFTYQHLALTRGCPGACTFCGSPRFWGRKVRSHSAAYFVEQMALLRAKGVTFFYVSDDTFTLNKGRVIEVCRLILERGLDVTWAAISRVDAVDAEVLAWMRRAGCIQLSFGVESGSERVRRVLGKKTSQEAVRKAFALTAAHAILARAYLIYGCPGDDEQSLAENLACLREIKPLIVLFHILAVFPGTALWDEVKARLGLDDTVWLEPVEDILYFQTDSALSQEAVLEYGRRLKAEYFRLLPSFAVDAPPPASAEFGPTQADFLSRLGMTFLYGDYARNDLIPDAQATAVRLFERALGLAPDRRAFFGLAAARQDLGDHHAAETLLAEALGHFPGDGELLERRAASLMELGRLSEAVELLAPLTNSSRAMAMAAECCKALGDSRAGEFRRRYLELP